MADLPSHVLVVDDDPKVRESLVTLLEIDFRVTAAGNIAEAERKFGEAEFDVVITDYDMPGGTGLQLVEWLRRRYPGVQVIVVSGHAGAPELQGAERDDSVVRVLAKPYDPRRLTGLVQSATRLARLRRATEGLKALRSKR